MAASVVQLQVANGAGPTLVSGEAGFKYNREDTLSGASAVPIPSATGTNYSWPKWLRLVVTVAGTTAITNRRIQLSATESAGLAMFFQGNTTYAQASAPAAAASGANGPATPAGYARATTALQVYDATSVATSSVGGNGQYCQTCVGLDATFAGGVDSAIPLPDVRLVFDEG